MDNPWAWVFATFSFGLLGEGKKDRIENRIDQALLRQDWHVQTNASPQHAGIDRHTIEMYTYFHEEDEYLHSSHFLCRLKFFFSTCDKSDGDVLLHNTIGMALLHCTLLSISLVNSVLFLTSSMCFSITLKLPAGRLATKDKKRKHEKRFSVLLRVYRSYNFAGAFRNKWKGRMDKSFVFFCKVFCAPTIYNMLSTIRLVCELYRTRCKSSEQQYLLPPSSLSFVH